MQIILESSGNELYGRVEGVGDFMPVTSGKDVGEIEKNIRDLIEDHKTHDGPDEWAKIDLSKVQFDYTYDLTHSSKNSILSKYQKLRP